MDADGALYLLGGAVIGILFREELVDAGYGLGVALGNLIVRWILR